MNDIIWLTAIALVSGIASYFSRIAGLTVIVLAVVVVTPIWGLAGGNPTVLAFIIPAIVGFVGGRLIRKVKVHA